MNDVLKRFKERCAALGIKPTPRVIGISIAQQLLMFFQDCALQKSHVISTSLRPPSNVKDSLGTPRGLHEIAEKGGHEVLANTLMLFVSLFPFFAFKELGRVAGRERLQDIFFMRRPDLESRTEVKS